VQQLAAGGEAEPAAGEAEGLPVLILRCAFRGQDIYVPVCIYLAASRGHSVIWKWEYTPAS
jgi:hypothetical protein